MKPASMPRALISTRDGLALVLLAVTEDEPGGPGARRI